MADFVLEIRWWLRIGDAKPSSNFEYNIGYLSDSMDTPSTNLQPHEISFGELTKCSETPTWLAEMGCVCMWRGVGVGVLLGLML